MFSIRALPPEKKHRPFEKEGEKDLDLAYPMNLKLTKGQMSLEKEIEQLSITLYAQKVGDTKIRENSKTL
jgi:hypothetical protein